MFTNPWRDNRVITHNRYTCGIWVSPGRFERSQLPSILEIFAKVQSWYTGGNVRWEAVGYSCRYVGVYSTRYSVECAANMITQYVRGQARRQRCTWSENTWIMEKQLHNFGWQESSMKLRTFAAYYIACHARTENRYEFSNLENTVN